MTRWRRLRLLLPRYLRELPADLAALLLLVGCVNVVVFVPVIQETPFRIVVGLIFVLFVPGYAFIAALFPEAGTAPTAANTESNAESDAEPTPEAESTPAEPSTEMTTDASAALQDRGIDGIERVALSFGLSIAIVPLIGLALNFTPFGIRLVPIVVSLSAFTIITTAVAALRRWDLPPDERFHVPYREWLTAGKQEVFNPETQLDAILNVALAIAVLLAVSSVVYAVAVPPQGEQFSEFYILTEDDDGELVADGYPDEFTVGEQESLFVGIGNNEYESLEYTVIIQLQAVETDGNESQVRERIEVDRWATSVGHNETSIQQRNITLSEELTGEELRLQFLLYADEAPASPTRENAYRDLHLWVSVSDIDDS